MKSRNAVFRLTVLSVTLAAVIGHMTHAVVYAQDSTESSTAVEQSLSAGLLPADELMADVLDLKDPMLSIWPGINDLELESLLSAVKNLREAYESDRLDADDRAREVLSMISHASRDEEKIKDLIKVAKDADNDAEENRLKDLKKDYETRRKYLTRIGKIRDGERELAEARIDYASQLDNVLSLATQLVSARESGGEDDLLGTERELIRQSKELGVRSGEVSSKLKKVNGEREKAYKEREKLIAGYR